MGHLVNANGFRLGISRLWRYKLLVNRNYFKEVNTLKFLGFYLENFFNVKKLREYGFLYSHFVYRKSIYLNTVEIYLYGGYFDVMYNNFLKSRKFLKKPLYFRKYVKFCQNSVFSIIRKRLLFDLLKFNVVDIRFYFSSEFTVTSEIIGRLIAFKLENLYTLNQVINPIVKNYLLNKKVGLTLVCSGRFTRKERAHFVRFRVGSVPFSTVTRGVNYFFISVILKYGVCGVKVWLAK